MVDRQLSISKGNGTNIQKSVFSIVAFVLIIFCIGNFLLGLNRVNKPYPGFFFYKNLVVTDISPKAVNGEMLKRFKDKIKGVNGIPVRSPDEVFEIMRMDPRDVGRRLALHRGDQFLNQGLSSRDVLRVDANAGMLFLEPGDQFLKCGHGRLDEAVPERYRHAAVIDALRPAM